MEILILSAKTGMDIYSKRYEDLSKDAVHAIKQACLGVNGVTTEELATILQSIADAPLNEQFRT
eukprot:6615496-Lingulodinium_polyedra.AAC.1